MFKVRFESWYENRRDNPGEVYLVDEEEWTFDRFEAAEQKAFEIMKEVYDEDNDWVEESHMEKGVVSRWGSYRYRYGCDAWSSPEEWRLSVEIIRV